MFLPFTRAALIYTVSNTRTSLIVTYIMRLVCEQNVSARWQLLLCSSQEVPTWQSVLQRLALPIFTGTVISYKVYIPLCGHHSYRRGGTALEHCGGLAVQRAGGRAVSTLTYQQILNLTKFSARRSMVNGSTTSSVLTVCHLQFDTDQG